MRAGLLKQRIDIEAEGGSRDSYGDIVESWSAVVSDVPATVLPLRGSERDAAARTLGEADYKVTIRYSTETSVVTHKHRVKWGARYFDIMAAINVGSRDRMIELMCRERVGES